LKIRRQKSLEEIHEILKKCEKESQRHGSGHLRETEGVYAIQKKNNKKCCICGKGNCLAKIYRHRKNHKEENYKANFNTKREGRKDPDVNRENMEKKKSVNNIGKSVDGYD